MSFNGFGKRVAVWHSLMNVKVEQTCDKRSGMDKQNEQSSSVMLYALRKYLITIVWLRKLGLLEGNGSVTIKGTCR